MTETTNTAEKRKALADARRKRYAAKPEVVERRKEYNQRPEVKARLRERAKTKEYQEYQKQYRSSKRGRDKARERAAVRNGFAPGQIDALLIAQDGKCAVCRRLFTDLGDRALHADHCHEQNAARGLLCQHCNMAEGMIKKTGLDPVEFATRLAHYLSSPPALRL